MKNENDDQNLWKMLKIIMIVEVNFTIYTQAHKHTHTSIYTDTSLSFGNNFIRFLVKSLVGIFSKLITFLINSSKLVLETCENFIKRRDLSLRLTF